MEDEVAVIDEIQMIKDPGRGWAWTRALLGLIADEIHLCGEAGAADLIRQVCLTTGEDVEVCHYKRLTDLQIEDSALGRQKYTLYFLLLLLAVHYLISLITLEL